MKKLFYLFIIICQFSWAQNAFEMGNAQYLREHYQDAIQSYESIINSGKQSAEVYYNLGNCYYKMNKVAPAIYNYEKALLLSPNDKTIENNLHFAQKLQIDDIKEIPEVGFAKLIHDFTSTYHYDTWAWIAVS